MQVLAFERTQKAMCPKCHRTDGVWQWVGTTLRAHAVCPSDGHPLVWRVVRMDNPNKRGDGRKLD